MIVIPAIDLKDGRCVRLRQGDLSAETVYSDDPAAMARSWESQGAPWLHVVDLNGAVDGRPSNLAAIEGILKAVRMKVQVGGGIRSIETVRMFLNAGVTRVVLGTAALMDRAFLDAACAEFPGRIVVGVDARNGLVAIKGWTAVSDVRAVDLVTQFNGMPLAAVVYTDIARDGMLNGPNIDALREIVAHTHCSIIASGGVTKMDDLAAIRAVGDRVEGAIVGKALYDGKLDYRTAVTALG
ncbi:1-(5-phosphoribosyl)-5-[(5-phosphoribosylamino) methylideneamino] imidazole-4-carboxamide isomerase [Nitrospira sp.]|nr:1-(5-phosphoribosyl)-5-[(5-phosphoribosylamino) methylideneamino] imidazole-4-carboxamide isomerase [Nitrospira sp.]